MVRSWYAANDDEFQCRRIIARLNPNCKRRWGERR